MRPAQPLSGALPCATSLDEFWRSLDCDALYSALLLEDTVFADDSEQASPRSAASDSESRAVQWIVQACLRLRRATRPPLEPASRGPAGPHLARYPDATHMLLPSTTSSSSPSLHLPPVPPKQAPR